MKDIRISKLIFDDIAFTKSQSLELRNYINNKYKAYDSEKRYDSATGKEVYKYPLFQFKLIDDKPCLITIGNETLSNFKKMFMDIKRINLGRQTISVSNKQFTSELQKFGSTNSNIVYKFIKPWLGLSYENIKKYKLMQSEKEKAALLNKCLTENIIVLCKSLEHRVEQTITCGHKLDPTMATLKGDKLLAFTGMLQVNFSLPNLIGLGRGVSLGYGTIKKR